MLEHNGEIGKFFGKSIPVTIKDGYNNQCRHARLFLTVEWQQAAASIQRQELKITLTDSNDPFFLYHLHLSEEDFQSLKSSQGLLVDFSAFPQRFIELIEICLTEENKSHPKFLLIFNVGYKIGSITSTSQLDIVEKNAFKHLMHLSLKFIVATDSVIKQYLAECFRNLKDDKQQLENKLTYLEQDLKEKLSACQTTLEKKSVELENVRKELSVELSVKESKHARELQEERERFLIKQRQEELRADRELKEKEQNFRKEIQQLETRVSCMEALNKELQDEKHRRDGTIRDLRSRILSLEEENKRQKDAINDYKEQNENLQSESREKRLNINHQKDEIDELQQELNFKKQRIAKLQEQVDVHQKQEKSLENELEEVKEQFQKCSKERDQFEQYVAKGNQIIRKLQDELMNCREKWQQRNLLVEKLEFGTSEKEKIIQMLQKDLKEVKMDYKRKNSEVKEMCDSISSLQGQVNKLEKDIKLRDDVIKYLNRELTERRIFPEYVPPPNLDFNLQNSAQAVTINSAGEPGITNLNNSPTTLCTENVKPLVTSSESQVVNVSSEFTSPAPADSGYTSVPSSNAVNKTKCPAGGRSSPVTNIELDSAALSAAFGPSQLLQHSTAKKSVSFKNAKKIKKKS